MVTDLAPRQTRRGKGDSWRLEVGELGHETLSTVQFFLEITEAEVWGAKSRAQRGEALVVSDKAQGGAEEGGKLRSPSALLLPFLHSPHSCSILIQSKNLQSTGNRYLLSMASSSLRADSGGGLEEGFVKLLGGLQ